jgi:predicted adenylyl cyclase CyaB
MSQKKNYEIKTPVTNYSAVRSAVMKLFEKNKITKKKEIQKDIYYSVPSGRLKLRIINKKHGTLISYLRKESKKLRVSNYLLTNTKDFDNLHRTLSLLFPVLVTVEKVREIFLFDNIRIHLDKVKNLGEFLEFEVVFDSFQKARAQMKFLISYFKLDSKKFINNSYSDILLKKNSKLREN